MYKARKNMVGNLAGLKNFATFALAKRLSFDSKVHTEVRDKAGLSCGVILSNGRRLATITRKARLLLTCTHNNFQTMPNVSESRIPRNNSTRTASYSRLERLTKQSLIDLIERRATAVLSPDLFFAAATSAFAEWMSCEERNLYAPTIRDGRLLDQLQSLRKIQPLFKRNF